MRFSSAADFECLVIVLFQFSEETYELLEG
jgi:hypothetical protein